MAEKLEKATAAERETLLTAVFTAKTAFTAKLKTMEAQKKVLDTFRNAERDEEKRRDQERQAEAKALFTRTKAQFDGQKKEFDEATKAKADQ